MMPHFSYYYSSRFYNSYTLLYIYARDKVASFSPIMITLHLLNGKVKKIFLNRR